MTSSSVRPIMSATRRANRHAYRYSSTPSPFIPTDLPCCHLLQHSHLHQQSSRAVSRRRVDVATHGVRPSKSIANLREHSFQCTCTCRVCKYWRGIMRGASGCTTRILLHAVSAGYRFCPLSTSAAANKTKEQLRRY